MRRRDYILEVVEQFSRTLAQVLGIRGQEQVRQAHETVAQTAAEYLALSPEQLEEAGALQLMGMARTGEPEQDTVRWLLLAELVQALGDIRAAEGQRADAATLYLKALDIATTAADSTERLPYFVPLLNALVERLEEYVIPVPLAQRLLIYYERSGQFAAAEDVLFDLLEQTDEDATIIELGLAFYDRLLQQRDYVLQSGGLPRAEVEEGLEELLTLQGR